MRASCRNGGLAWSGRIHLLASAPYGLEPTGRPPTSEAYYIWRSPAMGSFTLDGFSADGDDGDNVFAWRFSAAAAGPHASVLCVVFGRTNGLLCCSLNYSADWARLMRQLGTIESGVCVRACGKGMLDESVTPTHTSAMPNRLQSFRFCSFWLRFVVVSV